VVAGFADTPIFAFVEALDPGAFSSLALESALLVKRLLTMNQLLIESEKNSRKKSKLRAFN
jgi:hypothetical protein